VYSELVGSIRDKINSRKVVSENEKSKLRRYIYKHKDDPEFQKAKERFLRKPYNMRGDKNE